MNILGIHSSYTALSHDPSASLMVDGRVVAAIEEERLNRIKTSSTFFPYNAIRECLDISGLSIEDIDVVVSDGSTYPILKDKIKKSLLHLFGYSPKIELVNHAYSHVAGAFLSSGYNDSLVVSVDGLGDKISIIITSVKIENNEVKYKELYRADRTCSLGNFYTSFTNYLGFKSVEGEYKVMGMAAYGKNNHDLSNIIYFDNKEGLIKSNNPEANIDLENYSSISDPSYNENYIYGLTNVKRPLYSSKIFEQNHFDLATSVQNQFSSTYISLIRYWLNKTKQKYLCLSGGCVLNCLANKELLDDDLKGIYVMPAASDRGLSLGSALYLAGTEKEKIEPVENMYLGRAFDNKNIIKLLNNCDINYEIVNSPTKDCARLLKKGLVIGWFQGRAEFGPRALGHRSILANPQIKGMKDILNSKIKFRESYRPFAPAILKEDFDEYYESNIDFSYMTFTIDVPENLAKIIPEAVHFDGTARVQTVTKQSNSNFYDLLKEIKKDIGIGSVINTSFNLANEPIVDSPSDAIRTFFSSGIDVLYMNNIKLVKNIN